MSQEIGRDRLSSRRGGLFAVALLYLLVILLWALSAIRLELPLLLESALLDLGATVFVFAASLALNNSSLYDPYWSVIPPVLCLSWALAYPEAQTDSSALMLGMLALWALRLTANWASSWRGPQHEDWRYREFRARFGRLYWLVSLGAVHLFPTVVVFAASIPLYYGFTGVAFAGDVLAFVGAVISALAITIEAVADRQLADYRKSGDRRPLQSGMWAYSRHPNYFGEILFWLGALVFGYARGAPWWTAAGFVGVVLVFALYSIPKMDARIRGRCASGEDLEAWEDIPALIPGIRLSRRTSASSHTETER